MDAGSEFREKVADGFIATGNLIFGAFILGQSLTPRWEFILGGFLLWLFFYFGAYLVLGWERGES